MKHQIRIVVTNPDFGPLVAVDVCVDEPDVRLGINTAAAAVDAALKAHPDLSIAARTGDREAF